MSWAAKLTVKNTWWKNMAITKIICELDPDYEQV